MIPYLAQPQLTLAGRTFHSFGFLVAMALLVGGWMVVRRAGRFSLDRAKVGRLTIHILCWGFYGALKLRTGSGVTVSRSAGSALKNSRASPWPETPRVAGRLAST